MTAIDTSLLGLAVIAALTSKFDMRSLVWLLFGAASFAASAIYWRSGLPHAPAFTFACDAIVCFAIYAGYRHRWERALFAVFLLSCTISLLYQLGAVQDHKAYSISVETLSVIAIFIIGGHRYLGNKGDGIFIPKRGLRAYLARVGPSFLKTEH